MQFWNLSHALNMRQTRGTTGHTVLKSSSYYLTLYDTGVVGY